MKYYFAYGSNLHPIRLEDRLGPVELLGIGTLHYTTLTFNKVGSDGSGKATILTTSDPSKRVMGAVYSLSKKQEKLLDGFESLGKGYHKSFVEIEMEEENNVSCFTYEGMSEYVDDSSLPFYWYVQLVVLGGQFLDLPEDYIQFLKSIKSVKDQDEKRQEVNQRLIKLMKQKNRF